MSYGRYHATIWPPHRSTQLAKKYVPTQILGCLTDITAEVFMHPWSEPTQTEGPCCSVICESHLFVMLLPWSTGSLQCKILNTKNLPRWPKARRRGNQNPTWRLQARHMATTGNNGNVQWPPAETNNQEAFKLQRPVAQRGPQLRWLMSREKPCPFGLPSFARIEKLFNEEKQGGWWVGLR